MRAMDCPYFIPFLILSMCFLIWLHFHLKLPK